MPAFVWMTVVTALRILGRNRLRAGLTMLGIVIGVGAVIAMVGIGEGAKRAVQAQIATMGTNVIIVWPGVTTVSGVRGGQGGAVTLTVADALDLKKKIPLLAETGWAKRDVMQIVNGNRNWNGPINGISPSYLTIRDWSFSSGGPFTQTDLDSAARVALLGQTIVDNLFDEGEEPVGAVIRIKNVPFRVIGVLAPKGQSAQGSDQDDVIFIPFSTAERKVFGTAFLGSVGALFASTDRAEEIAARTVNKDRARAGESKTRSKSSMRGKSPSARGGQHSGTNRPKGRTKEQLYNEAKKLGVDGRSKMSKAQLQRAVDRRK